MHARQLLFLPESALAGRKSSQKVGVHKHHPCHSIFEVGCLDEEDSFPRPWQNKKPVRCTVMRLTTLDVLYRIVDSIQ